MYQGFYLNVLLFDENLTLSQTTKFRLFQTEREITEDNFKFDENRGKFSKRVENTVGKGETACFEQFLLFPLFSKDLYSRHIKTRVCFGKGTKVKVKLFLQFS